MPFERLEGRIDINSEITNGNIIINEEEQRGTRTNKFWFNNYEYMYKDVYSLTYEDYAELIANKIAKHLGIKCADYDLATYNGNKGVITRNLIEDNEHEELLSGTEILTQVYTEYIFPIIRTMEDYNSLKEEYNANNVSEFSHLPTEIQLDLRQRLLSLIYRINIKNKEITDIPENSKRIDLLEIKKLYEYLDSFIDIYNQKFIEFRSGIIKSNNLFDIWHVLETYAYINNLNIDTEKAMNDLINIFIFDIITSQGDRHADNWSIIKNNEDNSIRICPLYDNSGICSLNREKAIKNIISYVDDLNNPTVHDKKKEKIQTLLESTINHSNSALKVELEDVEQKNKNRLLLTKFIALSSQEFINRLSSIISRIDESTLDSIFLEIEQETKTPIPQEVKIVVKTVINNNLAMLNEITADRRKVK